MKNTINILFFTFLSVLMLIAFWENISSHSVDQRLYEIGRASSPMLIHPVTKDKILLPLGTDQNRRDYAVVLSSAFRYNLLISLKGAVVFLLSGIIILNNVLLPGIIVVSFNCAGIISPKPLNRLISIFLS